MSKIVAPLVLLCVLLLCSCQDKKPNDNEAGIEALESLQLNDVMLARSLRILDEHEQTLVDIGLNGIISPQRVANDSGLV